MSLDLQTLYVVLLGTLCVSALLTAWERRFQPARRADLKIWATGYLCLALGCGTMLIPGLPIFLKQTIPNFLIVAGYLTMLHGIVRLDDGEFPKGWKIAAAIAAVLWLGIGPILPLNIWHGTSSVFVALCGSISTWRIWRSQKLVRFRSRTPALAAFAIHTGFYLARVVSLPFMTPGDPAGLYAFVAKATMYEGILFSLAGPMLLLSLLREESEERITAASQTDFLTGLSNRRALFHQAERRLRDAAARDIPVAAMVFDLDHFKSINDSYGHQIGDEVIKLFARVAETELPADAILSRFGGEEFVALCFGYAPDEAAQAAQRVSQRFSRQSVRFDGLAIEATVSVGLAFAPSDLCDLDALLERADVALYRAKTLGRNRVEQAAASYAAAA